MSGLSWFWLCVCIVLKKLHWIVGCRGIAPAEQGYIGCAGRCNDTRLLAHVSKMWLGVLEGSASGSFALVTQGAFHGAQFQRFSFHAGALVPPSPDEYLQRALGLLTGRFP
jgi:hypothetical protein